MKPTNVRDLIQQMGGARAIHRLIYDAPYTTVWRWQSVGRIPVTKWRRVAEVARNRGVNVTVADIQAMHKTEEKA